MKKSIHFLIALALLVTCLSACSGYNKIMRDHLSDPESYQTYEAVLTDLYYRDPHTQAIVRDFEDADAPECDIMIHVKFDDAESVCAFIGGTPNPDRPLKEYEFFLRIPAASSKILYKNGFYRNISPGDHINVTASNLIYMDSNYFYVTQLEHDDIIYLNFKDGLKNVVDMMNKDKSLF